MPDEDLLDRLTEIPSSRGDRLTEILDPKTGGEAGRLRNKLNQLYESVPDSNPNESVARMRARNVAIRHGKGLPPRGEDPGGEDRAIQLLEKQLAELKARKEAKKVAPPASGMKPKRPDDPEKPDVNKVAEVGGVNALVVNIPDCINLINTKKRAVQVDVNNSGIVMQALTPKPKKVDRHKPGYMAEYMRERRKNKVKLGGDPE